MSTLAEINKNLQMQNKVLQDTSASMESVQQAIENLLQQDADQYKKEQQKEDKRYTDSKRQAAEDKRERARRSDGPQGFGAGFRAGVNPLDGSGIAGAAGGFAERILGGLFGGASFAAIMGTLGSLVGRGLVFGGIAALVANFGRDILNNLFTDLAPEMSETDRQSLSGGLTDAARNGLLVSIASRKAGLGVFVGGALGTAINSFLSDETRQEEFGTILGQEISNEQAINTAMQAAGLATMYGGPMAGLVVAIAGTGVVAMSRLQDWIENRRDEQLQILNDELESRAVEGQQLLETSWLDNLANRLGLNIQGEDIKSEQALVADQLGILEEIQRGQQAAVAPTLDYYGGEADPMSNTFGEGSINRSMLEGERAEEVARAETTLRRFMGDALTREGGARRAEIRAATEQSLTNMARYAELLGMDAERSFLESIIEEKRTNPVRRAPVENPGVTIGEITGEIPASAAASPSAAPSSADRLATMTEFNETIPRTAVIDPSQMDALLRFVEAAEARSGGGGGGGGQTPQIIPVPVPTDRFDNGRDW